MRFINCSTFLLLAFILSAPAFGTEAVTCKIKESESAPFKNFVDGTIYIDLETGNNRLHTVDEQGNNLQYISISDDLVSSFGADRKTCNLKVEKENADDGHLKSVKFVFENCEYRDSTIPDYVAYVGVIQSFNFETNEGVYQELFFDGGETKSPNFFFSECSIY